ncbi:MAG TPA: DUF4388 domain-containing protein [Candidatus Eisenbacteria bacterium]
MNPNPPAGSFSGELGVVGLFDLAQLLMLNGATGCLVVHSGAKRGFLYFVSGRMVNAVDDASAQGEAAATRILSWRSGAFQFRPERVSGTPVIQSSTEAVLLEAARRIDEASAAAGGGAPSATERLSERQASLEALRDVFRQVARDASASAGADAGPSPTLQLYELERPGDRLLYRPGCPPRMRRAGEWREPVEPVLTPDAYRKVRAYLLDACRPPAEGAEAGAKDAGGSAPGTARVGGTPAGHALRLADGRTIALEFVAEDAEEAMWLRPVGLLPPDHSRLRGSLDRLEQVLGLAHGMVLVGGPDLESAREMLHAVIAMVLTHSADSILLASGDPTYAHPEGRGVLLRTAPEALRGSLRSLQPDILALDPALGRGHAALHELAVVPRVIASVVVADPASLVPRWLECVDEGDITGAMVSLATTPIGLVMAYPGAIDADTLAFNAWILSERERALAVRGEVGTLSPLLQQATARVRMERRRRAA